MGCQYALGKCFLKINAKSEKFLEFRVFPICMDWLPSVKGGTDLLAVGFADGSF